MSDQNNNGTSSPGGGPRPSSSGPRIGRIGQWGNSGNTPSDSRSSSGPRFATLGDLASSSDGPVPPPSSEHSDGNDSNGSEGETWFTGGERSGLSVLNPNRGPDGGHGPSGEIIQNLLKKMHDAGFASTHAAGPSSRAVFSGSGHTLGSDEVESQVVPDPNALPEGTAGERVVRHVTFWRNGFTIEDGPLMSYDDPRNTEILRALDTGQAPADILDVHYGQDVELRVARHLHEDYAAPQRAHQAFEGTGHRLGAPTPSIAGAGLASGPAGLSAAAPAAATRSDEVESLQTKFEVDQSQPTTTIQLRLADGTRIPCRMNLTHTIGDIRNFINASRPENLTRPYTISIFPNRILDDDTQTIEAAGLKNTVVIQRWA